MYIITNLLTARHSSYIITVYFLITAPKKKKNLRHGLALKLEHKNYTSISAATYMTVHWHYYLE